MNFCFLSKFCYISAAYPLPRSFCFLNSKFENVSPCFLSIYFKFSDMIYERNIFEFTHLPALILFLNAFNLFFFINVLKKKIQKIQNRKNSIFFLIFFRDFFLFSLISTHFAIVMTISSFYVISSL